MRRDKFIKLFLFLTHLLGAGAIFALAQVTGSVILYLICPIYLYVAVFITTIETESK